MWQQMLATAGVAAMVACGQPTSRVAPPKTRNAVAELRRTIAPFPEARANPQPDPNLLSCFSVSMTPDLHELSNVPRVIRLTSESRGQALLQRRYAVESGGASSPFWFWAPYTNEEIRIAIGDGSGGWEFTLRRIGERLEGPGEWRNDTLSRRAAFVSLHKIACTND